MAPPFHGKEFRTISDGTTEMKKEIRLLFPSPLDLFKKSNKHFIRYYLSDLITSTVRTYVWQIAKA